MTTFPLRTALLAGAAYTGIIGIGMAVMHHGYGYDYGMVEMVRVLWLFELLGAAFLLWAVRRGGGMKLCGFGALDWRQLLWTVPWVILIGLMLSQFLTALMADSTTPAQWRMVGLAAFTTALVGFTEELAFRGIVLQAALKTMSVRKAMLVSAVAFSLLHAVNVFGGLAPGHMLAQLGITFLVGMVLAPVALRLGSLWPLVIWHALWDFLLFASDTIGVEYSLTIAGSQLDPTMVHYGISLVLLVVLWVLPVPRSRAADA